MEKMTPEAEVWIKDFIKSRRWQTAKSGPPHSYTIRDWLPERSEEFLQAIAIVRKYGVAESFYNRSFIYLYLDGSKYWTMGAPIDETIVLNRAAENTFYGRQYEK